MPGLVLSTCGTSLLTNLAGGQRGLVTKHANARAPEEVPEADRDVLAALVQKVDDTLREASAGEYAEYSAELNGLLLYYEGCLDRGRDTHWLIATDTWLGTATAEALARVLEEAGHIVEVKRIGDLRTDSLEEFRCAMAELARLCAREVRGYREAGWRVVFNLTGGFKSVQGFMQVLGMLYADESVYVFERTRELLRLPRLPISLDARGLVRSHQRLFRRLAAGLPVPAADVESVPDTLIMELDGQVTLSVWGEVVWAEAGHDLLEERLWEPMDDKLRFGPGFEETVSGYDKDRIRQVNQRLMQLARHLHEGSYNPRALDFKQLAVPHGASTHECDAWADQDARRMFGHFDGGVFVLDALGKALH